MDEEIVDIRIEIIAHIYPSSWKTIKPVAPAYMHMAKNKVSQSDTQQVV